MLLRLTVCLSLFGCAASSEPLPAGSPSAAQSAVVMTKSGPEDWEVLEAGVVVLQMRDEPGFLIDANAPPPPPGSPPSKHAFLTATCVGPIPTCSKLGGLVRAAPSWGELVKQLVGAGYEVRRKR